MIRVPSKGSVAARSGTKVDHRLVAGLSMLTNLVLRPVRGDVVHDGGEVVSPDHGWLGINTRGKERVELGIGLLTVNILCVKTGMDSLTRSWMKMSLKKCWKVSKTTL